MALPLSYNWRNLLVRKLSSLLTLAVVAIVVFVLTLLLSFSSGIQASLNSSGEVGNVIVIKPGATAESTSLIMPPEVDRVRQAPNIATGPDGAVLVSPEHCMQTSIPRLNDGSMANVALRGVDPVAFDVHRMLRITEGRRFEPGAQELIVGKAATERYRDLKLGSKIMLGRASNREFTIVGVFEAGGAAIETEIWAPRTILLGVYDRSFNSSVLVRLTDPQGAADTIEYLKSPAVQLTAMTERDYYADLSRTTLEIVYLTIILITIMGIGAAFAVSNTMYAAVDRRRREIAILRTLGFSRASVVAAFLIESVFLCIVACLLGLIGSLFLNGMKQDYLSNSTWTVHAFEMKITPAIVLTAVLVSSAVGLVGALFPALRAARIQIVEALRKA